MGAPPPALQRAANGHDVTFDALRRRTTRTRYVPDSAAQGLRTRTSRSFGIVISSTTNPIFARVLMAIEQRAHEMGYDLILTHSHDLLEREEKCIYRLLARRVDGIFISPVYRLSNEAQAYQELRNRGTPVVVLGHTAPFCSHFVNIEADDVQGSYEITRHLLGHGHRRIAFLSGPLPAPWTQATQCR